MMPYAPGLLVRRGSLLFLSGVTAAPVYHSHPHRDEEFDLPPGMREQATLAMENLKKTIEAAGGLSVRRGVGDALSDGCPASRTISIASGLRIWALTSPRPRRSRCRGWRHIARCKLEISAIAVVDAAAPTTRASARRVAARAAHRADGLTRLHRTRRDGQPHGPAAPRRRARGRRLQPHRRPKPLPSSLAG